MTPSSCSSRPLAGTATAVPSSFYYGFFLLLALWNAVLVAGQQNCPEDSIFHCNDPDLVNALWDVDPVVSCDPDTCAWVTDGFLPNERPVHCQNLAVIEGDAAVSDWLEPCLLWELTYGEFAPTASPTLSQPPSVVPSQSPSEGPSSIPSLAPTTRLPTSAPSIVADFEPPTSEEDVDTDPTPTNEDQPTTSKDFDSILLTFVFPHSENRRRGLLRKLSTLSISSRAELYYLTDNHLKAKIPNLDGLRLVVTPYQEVDLNGQVAVTEMLQGTLYFATPVVMDADEVEALIRNAFTGGDLSDYVNLLEDSVDPVLSRVATVAYGIPLGIPDTVQGTPNGRPGKMDTEDDDDDSSINVIWIIVAVCGSLGLLGLVVVACVSHSQNGQQRYRRFFGLKANNTGLSSPTSSMQPQLIRRMQSVDVPSPTSEGGGQGNVLYDDVLPEGTQGNDVVFNDMQSDITSVYSYLDKTGLNESYLTDDHSYSIAPSLLMRKSGSKADGDVPMGEDDASSMWSVLDGIVNGDVSTMEQQGIEATASSPPADYSPESRTMSPEDQPPVENNPLYIFNDDDDALSFGSETSEVKNSKAMNLESSPIRQTSLQGSFDESQIKSLVEPDTSVDSNEAKEFIEELEKPHVAPVVEDRASLASILRPKDGLSYVSEASETSGTSRASAEGRLSATPSISNKKMSTEHSLLDDSNKEESTDDDSSLFMGPETFPKENRSDKANVLSLGDDNKVESSDEKGPYRIASLFRGSRQLTEKDKDALGIRPAASRDDSSLGESMIYPGSYAVADFRDDMSISTAGSRKSRKYSVSTMASF